MDEEPKGQKIPTKIRPYLFLDPLFCSSDFWLSKDLLCTNSERLSILYTEQTLKFMFHVNYIKVLILVVAVILLVQLISPLLRNEGLMQLIMFLTWLAMHLFVGLVSFYVYVSSESSEFWHHYDYCCYYYLSVQPLPFIHNSHTVKFL